MNGVQWLLASAGVRRQVWELVGNDFEETWRSWWDAPELVALAMGAGVPPHELAALARAVARGSPSLAARVYDELRWLDFGPPQSVDHERVPVLNAWTALADAVGDAVLVELLKARYPLPRIADGLMEVHGRCGR